MFVMTCPICPLLKDREANENWLMKTRFHPRAARRVVPAHLEDGLASESISGNC